MELKLSDCFEATDDEKSCLECTAIMLNINYGHNQELMHQCRRLEEYAIFVRCVREYMQLEGCLYQAECVDGFFEETSSGGVGNDFDNI